MKKEKKYSGIGGQAGMEGIMMRNEDRYSVAVRKQDGEIELKVEEYKPGWGTSGITKLPFIRGIFVMINSLVLGYSTLSWSAEFFAEEEEETAKEKKPDPEASKPAASEKQAADQGEKKNDMGLLMVLSLVLSVVLSIVIFMLLPWFVTELIRKHLTDSNIVLSIVEGVLRLLIFVGYVAAISLMDDIKRVYMYHGAEHKCINCIENGMELKVENVMKSSRLHPRCGTSFMLFVMIISIILFFFIRTDSRLVRLCSRIVLIPVIAGISYEVIRLAGSSSSPLVKILSAPGLALQRLTTREPDESMAEVAIAAVEAVFDWRKYLKETFGGEGNEVQEGL